MNKETREAVIKRAGDLLDAEWHCSEGVLIAAGERYFDVEPMIRLATPFAGGVGCAYEELCGALTGGIMVIGGAMGRSDADTEDQACQDTAVAYRKAFLAHFGYLRCCELKENWVGQPGQPDCVELVRQAAGVLVDVLGDAGVKQLTKVDKS